MTDQQKSTFNYCLRLGDMALIHSYRLSEWCSNGPILEEDLALTNFALDMLGRAQALLKYAGEVEGIGHTEDDLAYRRGERRFLNPLIAELPNGDFAQSMARMLYIGAFENLLYTELLKSKDETLAAIAGKAIKEIRYHLSHAADWVIRLGDGTAESHDKMQRAINDMWTYTGDMFDMSSEETKLANDGIAVNTISLLPSWNAQIGKVLAEATLTMPTDGYMQSGSLSGVHTEHLGHILSEMQYLQRAYPDASW